MNRTLVFLLVLFAVSAGAEAGPWSTNAGVLARVFFTDNLFLAPIDEESDTILQLVPYVSAEREGVRASARVVYGPSIGVYLGNSDLNRIDHVLQANGQAEVVKNIFFVRASATANTTSIDPTRRTGFDSLANPDASTQYATVAVEPYLQFPLGTGRFATTSIRSGFSYVFTEETADARANQGVTARRTAATIESGPYFTRMPWSIEYSQNIFDTESDDSFWRADGRVSYRFNPRYLAFLRLGYAEGDFQSSTDRSGPTWQVGLTWRPSPRTNLTAAYGEAFFGDDSFLELQHRHKRTVWRARYAVSVEDFRESLLRQEVIPATDEFGDPIVDPFPGSGLLVVDNTPILIDNIFVRQRVTGSVATTRGRTTARLQLDVARDTYQQGQNPETTSSQAVFDIQRRLSPTLSAGLRLRYWDYSTDGADDGSLGSLSDYEQYQVSLLLTRRLTPRTSVGLTVDRNERKSESELNSYDENRISAFLAFRFK